MITEKQSNAVRDVLIKAIENRVEGMDTASLLSFEPRRDCRRLHPHSVVSDGIAAR